MLLKLFLTKKNQYVINHKHHYNYIIQEINKVFKINPTNMLWMKNGMSDMYEAIDNCFGIQYAILTTVIQEIHRTNMPKGGQYCGFDWEALPFKCSINV